MNAPGPTAGGRAAPLAGAGAGLRSLARRDLVLIALGMAVWVGLGAAGVWYVHLLTQPRASCGRAIDPETRQAKGTTSPGHGLNVLTGQARCQ